MSFKNKLHDGSDTKSRLLSDTETETDDDAPIYEYGSLTQDDSKDTPNGEILEPVKSKCAKCWNFLLTLTIEPFIFIYMFSYMMHAVVTTKMVMDKKCKNEFNFSEEICSNLSAYEKEKEIIERSTNDFQLYSQLIMFAPASVAMIFIGTWSDIYGRKPPLLLALCGVLLEDIGLILNAFYYEAPVNYVLLSSVPSGLSGGFVCVLSITYSLASEVSTKRRRTIKYALIELGFGFGMTMGGLVGGQLYKRYANALRTGYITVFATSAVGHAMLIPWVLLLIAETQGKNLKVSWRKKICDLFSFKNVAEGFKACMKVRENRGRCQIWLLMVSMCAVVVTYTAMADVAYLFVFHVFGWDPTKYANVNAIFSVMSIVISIVCIPFFIRVLKFGDPGIGLAGTVSLLLKNVLIAFSRKEWLYYLGNLFGLLSAVAPLSVRSRISKIVRKDELGKVFSFLAACESLMPLLGTIVITRVYNATVAEFPGACYLLAAALLTFPLFTFIWLCFLKTSAFTSIQTVYGNDESDFSGNDKDQKAINLVQ